MATLHLHYHQGPPQSFLKLFTLSLPLFFCLLSWASSTTTPAPPPPPPSAVAASQALNARGYFLFAALINATAATGTDSWNGTGTVFAPPDLAFSFTAAKFNNYRRYPPPRPSGSLLLFHTLKQRLTSHNLKSRADGDELRTWHTNRCVFISKGFNGDLAIAGAKIPIVAVKIRQPDLYVDDHLVVHGVDGVLGPISVSKCLFPDPTAQIKSQIDRSFLDHSVRVLRRRGFSVVATAMAIKGSDLISRTALTVFAPSDTSLFSVSDGFRYDFLHHVVPNRHRFTDIASLSAGTTIETLSQNKTLVIRSENGEVTVNGVAIDSSEVYHNRWIVVLSVSRTIDDPGDSEAKTQTGAPAITPSESGDSVGTSPFTGDISESRRARVPSMAPKYSDEVTSNIGSPARASTGEYGQDGKAENSRQSPSPALEGDALADWRCSPGVSPSKSEGVMSTISLTVEGEDLFCPVTVRTQRDLGAERSVYVEQSPPSIADGQLSEKLAQSGPSHQFNKVSEPVVGSVPFDENETGQLSDVGRSTFQWTGSDTDRRDHFL